VSLQRRLLLYLLLCAPLVWTLALLISLDRARGEVNELFDVELVRLARQVQATLAPLHPGGDAGAPAVPPGSSGEADLRDLAVAIWDANGKLMVTDREGAQLRFRPDTLGFIEERVGGEPWRVYYLRTADGSQTVAAGQREFERDELVFSLAASQIVPWLVVLPLLLAAMAWAVRRALAPVRLLTSELGERAADNLMPVAENHAPAELKPLVGAINGLFARIATLLARERRFTADAAHELRTPLAALRAQWDVVRRAAEPAERARSEAQFEASLERMDRLVTQMLALSRADAADGALLTTDIRWTPIVEQAMSDCLALAERRGIELACEWPPGGAPAFPLRGDPQLLTVLLRNLLDNGVRYAPRGSTVWLRLAGDVLRVENEGALAPEQLESIGERFHRPPGQQEPGSGLGLSIVQRIAALHGLDLSLQAGAEGRGVRASVQRVSASS
jgi:two-component system sensor histidine kinase QseC